MLAVNVAIAHSRNLCHIDVLDALTDFAVYVEYSAFSVRVMACTRGYMLTCGGIARTLCIGGWQGGILSVLFDVSALSGLSAVFISHNVRDGYIFDDEIRALQSLSDQAQPEELGIAHVRIDGIAALYGGETQAAQALLAALTSWFAPRGGVASGKFAAYAVALRHASRRREYRAEQPARAPRIAQCESATSVGYVG